MRHHQRRVVTQAAVQEPCKTFLHAVRRKSFSKQMLTMQSLSHMPVRGKRDQLFMVQAMQGGQIALA